MSYKYRNDGTPDHVDSSQSNAEYPHVGIPVAQADATNVAKPNYREVERLKAKSDSLGTAHKDATDRLKGKYAAVGMENAPWPLAVLGEAIEGDSDAKTILRTENQAAATKDSLDKAKKPRG